MIQACKLIKSQNSVGFSWLSWGALEIDSAFPSLIRGLFKGKGGEVQMYCTSEGLVVPSDVFYRMNMGGIRADGRVIGET